MEGRVTLPPDLNTRINRALDAVDAESDRAVGRSSSTIRTTSRGPRRSRFWLAQAASLLVACALSAAGTWWLADRAQDTDRLERELFNAHVRSLLQESPVQVATSEHHTLRPWFAGRTDVAPPVKDLTADGFPLIGGRLDYVDGHRASVLVYKHSLHMINVFMWPAAGGGGDTAPVTASRNGYNMLSLRRGGITFWLVSDVNAEELKQLADRL
jgi:anti-sigma factor RsiW